MRNYYTSTCMPKRKIPVSGEDVEKWELSCIAGGNAKWYSHFERQLDSFLQSSTFVLLDIYPTELKLMSTPKLPHKYL